jgi:hypothetical protein
MPTGKVGTVSSDRKRIPMTDLLQIFLLCSLSLMDCQVTEIPADTGPNYIFCPQSLKEMGKTDIRGSLKYQTAEGQRGVMILACPEDS